jgi:hypothetical protein
LKRTLVFVLLLFISIFIPTHNVKAYNAMGVLNNETLSSDIAIKDGNIVMISYIDSVSSKTHNNMEIYNINRLDDFIKSIDKGKKDKILIAEYGKNVTGTWVNKLFDLKYDGKKIIYIEYDSYSNPNAFIPSQPQIFSKIIKRDYPNAIAYRICYSEEDKNNECGRLISFHKNSIIGKKK